MLGECLRVCFNTGPMATNSPGGSCPLPCQAQPRASRTCWPWPALPLSTGLKHSRSALEMALSTRFSYNVVVNLRPSGI